MTRDEQRVYDEGYADAAETLAADLLEFIEADELHQDPANVRAFLESWIGYQLEDDPDE